MTQPQFMPRFAQGAADLAAVQKLRYDVFVIEMGASGAGVDHARTIEADRFDPFARHLMVEDVTDAAAPRLVGVYRLMTHQDAAKAGGFYSQDEFDLAPILATAERPLELGRSCVDRDYRTGAALGVMWAALAQFVADYGIDVMFGTASFAGTDLQELQQPLACLNHAYLAPPDIRAKATGRGAAPMPQLDARAIDRKAAMLAMPPLIKSYLRLGGVVGEGVYVDHDFNTTDVCMILQTAKLSQMARKQYGTGRTP